MIGIDTISLNRIKKTYEKFGNKFFERYLNKKEIFLAKKIETYAGFWAAKEAASKAIGTGIGETCSFYDIKIKKNKLGAPKIKYSKKIRKKFNIKKSYLSITHNNDIVIAVVINKFKNKRKK